VIPDHEVGDYRDLDALSAVTRGCEVVTFDHEHVPTQHLEALTAAGVACRPGPGALVHAQDKAVMRERLGQLGVPCPRNAVVASVADVEAFGFPCVLKTTRGGYDGKGVWFVHAAGDCAEPLAHHGLVLRMDQRAGPGAAGDASGRERLEVLGRHVLVVEGDDLAAPGDGGERVEVAIVADLVVGDHLGGRDALRLGQQSQRDAEGRGGLRHHPRQLSAPDHGDGRGAGGHGLQRSEDGSGPGL